MKTIILCGGYGTRLAEETKVRPKPMVKVGTKPILKHIMNIYEFYNYNNDWDEYSRIYHITKEDPNFIEQQRFL